LLSFLPLLDILPNSDLLSEGLLDLLLRRFVDLIFFVGWI